MPEPRKDETRVEFLKRCIPQVIEEGTAPKEPIEQAVAICSSMWRKAKGIKQEPEMK
jgi:hypothetical protein